MFKVTNQWRHDPCKRASVKKFKKRSLQTSDFERIRTQALPGAITNWAAEPQAGIIANSSGIVVPVEDYVLNEISNIFIRGWSTKWRTNFCRWAAAKEIAK